MKRNKKQIIRITESDLRNMIRNSVKRVLREDNAYGYDDEDDDDEDIYKDEEGNSLEEYRDEIDSNEWHGIDARNLESLAFYGLLVKDNQNGTFDVIYKGGYGYEYIPQANVKQLAEDVAKSSIFKGLLHYNGLSIEDWEYEVENNPIMVLYDVNSYTGLDGWI